MKNNLKSFWLLAFIILAIAACKHDPIIPAIPPGSELSFKNDVQPILAGNCNAADGCHGAVNPEKFTVLTYSGVKSQVKPGNAGGSKLIKKSISTSSEIMPPPPSSPLTSDQLAIISTWILEGAQDN